MVADGVAIAARCFSLPRQCCGWGWMLLPVKLGAFLEPRNFAEIRARLYRIHLFGHVIMLMALVALGTIAPSPPILVWPAVAVLRAASIVAVLAQAFYCHFVSCASACVLRVGTSCARVRAIERTATRARCCHRAARRRSHDIDDGVP
jgi:hypothetical protein